MRNCYDSLLSAAAATANSAYGNHLLPSMKTSCYVLCIILVTYYGFSLIKPICSLMTSMWLCSQWYFSDQIEVYVLCGISLTK
jgi:hypothetical protein